MLRDSLTIRYYQKLTDDLVEMWRRGHRYDDLRMFMEGYISCLRQTGSLEAHWIHRLEDEAFRFLRDPSNFELSFPQTEVDYY